MTPVASQVRNLAMIGESDQGTCVDQVSTWQQVDFCLVLMCMDRVICLRINEMHLGYGRIQNKQNLAY